jgi:hypothetical protein
MQLFLVRLAMWLAVLVVFNLVGMWNPTWSAEDSGEGASERSQRSDAGDAGVVPYGFERPPAPQEAPDTSVPPSNRPLGPEELQRAEALLPLLEGKQEFWAMGEFVHLGAPVVPVLTKALKMPSARVRYNAIETLGMIKDRSAVGALLAVATEPSEVPRIREHALRVAVRLDPIQAIPAIELMAKDTESTVRNVAAFEARYVRDKAVVPVLINLLTDEERFVAITAVQSLWVLTRQESELHDWEASTKAQREEWAIEWVDWWKRVHDTFQFPEPKRFRKSSPSP